ncbi:unnamed protein product [Kuraishia capsulata CBS 1993]|uniref:Protein LOT5 n=1 Tax=Kuraishia capsulata CBS 1993 TaxID=1382522 RepID=W6MWH6_9ASCO|nr:uncharacterized protein KUCA_T00003438001 [Kuraishia capsulata CBS 1993]CDK27460.1 unnamed protein product [Kuraishia capsulata CBS 1993]
MLPVHAALILITCLITACAADDDDNEGGHGLVAFINCLTEGNVTDNLYLVKPIDTNLQLCHYVGEFNESDGYENYYAVLFFMNMCWIRHLPHSSFSVERVRDLRELPEEAHHVHYYSTEELLSARLDRGGQTFDILPFNFPFTDEESISFSDEENEISGDEAPEASGDEAIEAPGDGEIESSGYESSGPRDFNITDFLLSHNYHLLTSDEESETFSDEEIENSGDEDIENSPETQSPPSASAMPQNSEGTLTNQNVKDCDVEFYV